MHWCETDCSYCLTFFRANDKHMNFNARYYYTCIKISHPSQFSLSFSHSLFPLALILSLSSNQSSLIFMRVNAVSFEFSLNTLDKHIQDL